MHVERRTQEDSDGELHGEKQDHRGGCMDAERDRDKRRQGTLTERAQKGNSGA